MPVRRPLRPPPLPNNLRIRIIDDSAVARRLLLHILSGASHNADVRAFGHLPSTACDEYCDVLNARCCPSRCQIPICCPVAAVRASEVGQFMESALCGADIIILDQYLDYEHVSYLGTDLLSALLQQGYAARASFLDGLCRALNIAVNAPGRQTKGCHLHSWFNLSYVHCPPAKMVIS